MKRSKEKKQKRNEAHLLFRNVCVETRELEDIPVRINLPCLQYISDPLEITSYKGYYLVFELSEIKPEGHVNKVIYRFRGIEEIRT